MFLQKVSTASELVTHNKCVDANYWRVIDISLWLQSHWWIRLQVDLSPLRHPILCILCGFFRVGARHSGFNPGFCWNIGQMLWECMWTGSHIPCGQGKTILLFLFWIPIKSDSTLLFFYLMYCVLLWGHITRELRHNSCLTKTENVNYARNKENRIS